MTNGVERIAAGTSRAFEGLYGRCYSAMIRRRWARRAFFGAWGGAQVLYDLDAHVARLAASVDEASDAGILDVPSGQGVVAELLADAGWRGKLTGLDLAERAIDVARGRAERRGERGVGPRATYVRGTALDMPFEDASFDAVVSLNGLHVMPDHAAFVRELARVVAPGGSVWLFTVVRGRGVRARGMELGGRVLRVLDQAPPTRARLDELVADAGLAVEEELGGSNLVGLRLVRSGIS